MHTGLDDPRFLVPPLPPQHLSRPRLLDRLDQAAPAALTVLSAGAGTGKTVLLSEWARRRDESVAWLALTPSDNNPRRFWQLFLEAGRAAGQSYPASAWFPDGTVELVDSVLRSFTEPPARPVIVLDDAHMLTHPEIVAGLDRIILRWPHHIQLILAARNDPLLPLHRYRLAGLVKELRAADLAMTTTEVRDLLERHGVRLPDEEVRTLEARTEGWPAGVRLAAMRMVDDEQPKGFVALLAMDEGSIGEYLTEEVLTALPEQTQSLLIRTSFLDDVTGPLADAVTGVPDCRSVLTALARTNSFVIPVDPERITFRYHPLFREMLRQLARSQSPGAQQEQYARASAWYREQGDVPRALHWSVRAGDGAAIRSVLAHGGLAYAFVGHQDLGPTEVHPGPPPDGASPDELAEFEVTRRAIEALTVDAASAEGRYAVPGRLPIDHDPELTVTALVAEMMLGEKLADFGAVDVAATRLLADEDLRTSVEAVPGLRSSALLAQARARLGAGRVTEVDQLLRRAMAALPPDETPVVRLAALSLIAYVSVSARPRHADEAIDQAEVLLAGDRELARPVILDLAVARRAHVRGNLTEMDRALRRARAAGPVHAGIGQAAAMAYAQATLLAARGELAQAQALLRDDPAVNRTAVGLFGVVRDRELAEIDTALGRPRSALQRLHPHRDTAEGLVAQVAAARAYLALGELDRAAASVRTVITTPSPYVDRLLMVDAALCDAEIAHRRGEEGRTAELLDRALQLADGEFVLPFVRATPDLKPVLNRHGTLRARWPAPITGVPHPDPAFPEAETLPDALTYREQAVLRLMATSMSTAEIAEELCLSVNTVKTHLAAIYRKLAVGRRREAVFRARQLELL
ncbi:LuxR C-terminal-related transcriptional regulator [Paractinoplanes brasiliensis]|uniref:LuxR family maltose regulon positive regulatory protein n=1 Tax=Paractinoplanes brasiliensis TaxID=52695 RepID=A0A4R6JW43_9ACTN|nr:LuxR C-terminal-related transcriptional regulator [Actinoplanes brasiliensis]TDO40467.1 LuxR family maltose regulon positive regulatory protein [Actinoplanes brasiliensis]GID25534.1 transcriptional regulator [Actinoplanes brasiliensis]